MSINLFMRGFARFLHSPDDAGGGAGGAPAAVVTVPQINDTPSGGTPAAGTPAAGATDTAAKPAEGAKPAGDAGTPALGADGKPVVAAADTAAKPASGVWAEDWREAYAGDDQAKLNVLKRFTDPKTALDALFAAQEKIRTGDAKKPLAKDATPEQTAAWRKENGIPDAPADYLKSLPETVKLSDGDKKDIDGFLSVMHGKNASPELVGAAIEAYTAAQAAKTAALQEMDVSKRDAAEESLRAEWGSDFKPNVNAMKTFIENNFPSDVQDFLKNSRLGDPEGTPLLCHPGIIKAFAQIGRELNPTGTLNMGKGMDSMDTIKEQKTALEKRMGTPEWYKDEKAQEQYRNLVDAELRLTGKK